MGDDGMLFLAYSVLKSDNFEDVGIVSTEIKRNLEKVGLEKDVLRRAAVICFEAEMNLALYTDSGGDMQVVLDNEKVEITIEDEGPGIADLEQAMQPGFSTAPLWVHEMGFGAGLGLPNIKMNSDEFSIESAVGKGTKIHSVIFRRKEGK